MAEKIITLSNLATYDGKIKTYIGAEIAKLVDTAPTTLDTLGELAEALGTHEDAYEALLEVVGEKQPKALSSAIVVNGDVGNSTTVEGVLTSLASYCNGIDSTYLNKTKATELLAGKADSVHSHSEYATVTSMGACQTKALSGDNANWVIVGDNTYDKTVENVLCKLVETINEFSGTHVTKTTLEARYAIPADINALFT
jgi:hypothetical protein